MPFSMPEKGPLSTSTRRLVAINFLQQLGFQSTYFVGIIGCATYILGAGALEISILVFCLNVFLVVGTFCAGVVIDAIGPRYTLVVSLVAMSAAGFVGWLAPVSYPMLYLMGIMNGFLFGVGTTAMDSYPRYMVDGRGELKRMNSLNNTATCLSVIVGPTLGGTMTTIFPTQYVFAILALCVLPAIWLVWVTPETVCPQRDQDDERRGAKAFFDDIGEGIKITFTHDELRLLFFIGFMGFFCYGAFDSLESLFYRDYLKVGTEWMGWLSAFAGVGSTIGSLFILKVPSKRLSMKLLSAFLLLTGVGSMVYTGTPYLLCAVVGQILTGLGFGAMGPVRSTLTQERCDPSYVGRVVSVMRVGLNSAGVLPLLVAPFLADAFGVQPVLFGASTLTALISGAFIVYTARRSV